MHFLNLTLGIRFEPVLGCLSRLKEMAPYTSMQMVSSNENNIVYPNSMKIDQRDEIDPDDKMYIRPEDKKKIRNGDGVFYSVHPIYPLLAASEDGQIINIKYGSPISCRQHLDTDSMQCGVRNLGSSKRLQRQVHRIVYECYNGLTSKGKVIEHKNGDKKDNRLYNLQIRQKFIT